jgi:hypothetical protein
MGWTGITMLRGPAYVAFLALSMAAHRPQCHTRQDARHIAEVETSGRAVAARPIDLNGATGGWEVLVHMPGQDRGWRVIIDRDNGKVRRRESCPNPRPKRARKEER